MYWATCIAWHIIQIDQIHERCGKSICIGWIGRHLFRGNFISRIIIKLFYKIYVCIGLPHEKTCHNSNDSVDMFDGQHIFCTEKNLQWNQTINSVKFSLFCAQKSISKLLLHLNHVDYSFNLFERIAFVQNIGCFSFIHAKLCTKRNPNCLITQTVCLMTVLSACLFGYHANVRIPVITEEMCVLS